MRNDSNHRKRVTRWAGRKATDELRNFTDLKGDGRLSEMCVQGFDINAEDAMLLLGLSSSKAQG